MISNKTLLLLIVCLSSIIYARDSCSALGTNNEPSSKKDCTDYKLTTLEKANANACCYVEMTRKSGTQSKGCAAYYKKGITKDYITEVVAEVNTISSISIDCGCNWLSLTMILTFLVLLF